MDGIRRLLVSTVALVTPLLTGCDDAPPAQIEEAQSVPLAQARLPERARNALAVPLFASSVIHAQRQIRDARARGEAIANAAVQEQRQEAADELARFQDTLSPEQQVRVQEILTTLNRLMDTNLSPALADRLDEENFRRVNAFMEQVRLARNS